MDKSLKNNEWSDSFIQLNNNIMVISDENIMEQSIQTGNNAATENNNVEFNKSETPIDIQPTIHKYGTTESVDCVLSDSDQSSIQVIQSNDEEVNGLHSLTSSLSSTSAKLPRSLNSATNSIQNIRRKQLSDEKSSDSDEDTGHYCQNCYAKTPVAAKSVLRKRSNFSSRHTTKKCQEMSSNTELIEPTLAKENAVSTLTSAKPDSVLASPNNDFSSQNQTPDQPSVTETTPTQSIVNHNFSWTFTITLPDWINYQSLGYLVVCLVAAFIMAQMSCLKQNDPKNLSNLLHQTKTRLSACQQELVELKREVTELMRERSLNTERISNLVASNKDKEKALVKAMNQLRGQTNILSELKEEFEDIYDSVKKVPVSKFVRKTLSSASDIISKMTQMANEKFF